MSQISLLPPAPPQDEGELLLWLRLIRSRRVGPSTFWRLLAEHGTAKDALGALPGIAAAAGVSDYEVTCEKQARAELKAGRLAGAALIAAGDPRYPVALAEITDAPPLLWAMGRLELLKRPALALVGARDASSLGLRMARKLARDLGQDGRVIVSGLAAGIDAAAHEASLPTGTIAVMPGGVDVIYPPDHAVLAQEIAQSGLRLSENAMGTRPKAHQFLARNRLISGLAQAVIVVEAAAKSGSLNTARHAADQGRDVMAVPGHPMEARAFGCNALIRDGATLVGGARDVRNALPLPADRTDSPTGPKLEEARPTDPDATHLQRDILGLIAPKPISEDEVIRTLALPPAMVSSLITKLELAGQLTRDPGGRLAAN